MKKKNLLFAIQVLCLIFMFPVYMIVELNHGIEKSSIKDVSPGSIRETEKTIIIPVLKDDEYPSLCI